jgi:N utilization substance protein A
MKGQRVQSIVQELGGEKIDIIPYDEDPARLVCNALQPAVVSKVIVDETSQSMDVVVADDQLSLAIGKRGQNVRLAAQLTGWKLDIKSESKMDEASAGARDRMAALPGIGSMRADILHNDGIKSVEDLAAASPVVVARILNLEPEEAEEICERVKAFAMEKPSENQEREELLANAFATPKAEDQNTKADAAKAKRIAVFTQLSGVGEAAIHALADSGYGTIGDVLADSAEEVAEKTELPLSVAKMIQIAADKFMQKNASKRTLGRGDS